MRNAGKLYMSLAYLLLIWITKTMSITKINLKASDKVWVNLKLCNS